MKKFKAVLFDLDGVLIDSSGTWWLAVNATLEKFGKDKVSQEDFLKIYWGPHLRESFKKINLGQDALGDCNHQYYNFTDEIKIFPETKRVLSLIKKKNFKVALVTNTPRDITLFSLKKFFLLTYFDVIIGGDDVKKGKPDPEMMFKACKLLGVNPSETLLVGDTHADILAGKKAGCYVLGIGVQGDKKIENLGEVVGILEELK